MWRNLDPEIKADWIQTAIVNYNVPRNVAEIKAVELFWEAENAKSKMAEYQSGPEGCIRWINDNIYQKVIPYGGHVHQWVPMGELPTKKDKYGRSYKTMWEAQQKVIMEALAVDSTGTYKHNLIALVWPRGLGKSFLAVCIGLYRFICFSYQKVYFSANSYDESDELHFSEAKTLLLNSPVLCEIIGENNILSNKIRFVAGDKNVMNEIKIISQKRGIVSNAAVVTQTEVFKQESDTFFAQWYGSLRMTHNALGIIDSTVSDKSHWLYRLYRNAKKDPGGPVYFNYYGWEDAKAKYFWHPGMTDRDLAGFKTAMSRRDFDRYYNNLWGKQGVGLFDNIDIGAIGYFGANGVPICHEVVKDTLKRANKKSQRIVVQQLQQQPTRRQEVAAELIGSLMPVEDFYSLGQHSFDKETTIRRPSIMPGMKEARKITDALQTNLFSLLVGIDRAEPNKFSTTGAKTVVSWMIKVPAGEMFTGFAEDPYMYVLFGLAVVENSMSHPIITLLSEIHNCMGIDFLCGDRYNFSEISPWCDQNGIKWRSVNPTLEIQRQGFGLFIRAVNNGLFKAPPMPVAGVTQADILREELSVFDELGKHKQTGVSKYGSPQKHKANGIQDDAMDSIGIGMFGGMGITKAHMIDKFAQKKSSLPYLKMINGPASIQDTYSSLYM